jgi:hypothetical protein
MNGASAAWVLVWDPSYALHVTSHEVTIPVAYPMMFAGAGFQ